MRGNDTSQIRLVLQPGLGPNTHLLQEACPEALYPSAQVQR